MLTEPDREKQGLFPAAEREEKKRKNRFNIMIWEFKLSEMLDIVMSHI